MTSCLLVMLVFVVGGAILFSAWEGWDYVDGSYFCFTSLLTIGFGDFVPGNTIKQVGFFVSLPLPPPRILFLCRSDSLRIPGLRCLSFVLLGARLGLRPSYSVSFAFRPRVSLVFFLTGFCRCVPPLSSFLFSPISRFSFQGCSRVLMEGGAWQKKS